MPTITHMRAPQPLRPAARRSDRAGVLPRLRAPLALVLAALLAIGSAGAAVAAAPPSGGLDAPIRAFGWPADGIPNDPYFGIQTDLAPIDLTSAWARTTGDASVVIAVLDTGLDAANPEFTGRVVPGFNALTGVADGPTGFAATADDAGHGTHVAGTIAAGADNGTGIAGIAPNVTIMPIKVLSNLGEGDFGGMVTGMNWAIAHGARIVSMSLGGTLEPALVPYLQQTFDQAHAAGVIVIAASGNDGATLDEYPCNFTHVICVGSTTNNGMSVSSFSTRTDALTLVAPGERIASTVPGNQYAYSSGTSMATPHVTGAVALLRSVRPNVTPDEVLASLIQSARPLTTGGHNPASGYGLLQVGAALSVVAGASVPIATPTPTPTSTATPTPTPTPTPAPGTTPTPAPSPTPVIGPAPSPVLSVPRVTAASPHNGTRSVLRSIQPRISFSIPMTAVSTRTIRMMDLSRGKWVAVRISYSASTRVATITPLVRLAANHSYRITVGAVLSASAGTALARPYVLTFRTRYR